MKMATASIFLLFLEVVLFYSMNIAAMVRPLSLRVVSYNVLSSHLADPSHFSTLNPDHLARENRLPMVLDKLETEIQQNSLICLQEVSNDWAGALHTLFANRGYHLVTGLYGKKFNGYMGVAIAWPTALMKCIDVDISRLSDKREGGWPKAPPPGIFERVSNKIGAAVRPTLEQIGVLSRAPVEPWEMSQNRFNILLTVTLQEKISGKSFLLGNYHMPCVFYAPKVMTIHCEMAAKHVQNLAADLPYILAGDWNIKPSSSSYHLVTTGLMDRGDPEFPEPKFGMEWKPTAKAMRSAYAESEEGEPDFTNFARVGNKDPFIDTLDYIFLSDHWKVDGVKSLPKRDDAGGPFPNLDRNEPSDHILIAADLQLIQ